MIIAQSNLVNPENQDSIDRYVEFVNMYQDLYDPESKKKHENKEKQQKEDLKKLEDLDLSKLNIRPGTIGELG